MARPLPANEICHKITLELHDGTLLDGEIYCDTSKNSIQKVLNDDRKFLPVKIADATLFIAKAYIVKCTNR